MQKILLHQCCGPCSIYPINTLIDNGFQPVIYFYNPNIHPIYEFYKRLESAVQLAKYYKLEYYFDENYGLKEFLDATINNINERCIYCYKTRLENTCKKAVELGIDTFTSSILYSKMQKHDIVKQIGDDLAIKFGLKFYYSDFRTGWQNGIDISKELGLYRQSYCGCIFSEEDRYKNQLERKFAEGKNI